MHDTNGDGGLSYQEFQSHDINLPLNAFDLLDRNGNGVVSKDELAYALQLLAHNNQ